MPARPILVAESPILNQVRDSELSKRGQTTLTGIFEGRPQNSIIRSRDFQVPREDPQGVRVDPAVLTNRTGYTTYLDSLKPYINRGMLSNTTKQGAATTAQPSTAQPGTATAAGGPTGGSPTGGGGGRDRGVRTPIP